MLIVGLDLETTGLDVDKGDKIIEVAILSYDGNIQRLYDTYVKRVDPERAISPKAQEIHGISYESLVGSPKWKDISQDVLEKLSKADLIVIHNAAFDAPFIATQLLEAGRKLPQMNIFCTMENGRWATPNGKLPNLGELAFSLGVEYDPSKAHGADYDVRVLMACFFKGFNRGFFKPQFD